MTGGYAAKTAAATLRHKNESLKPFEAEPQYYECENGRSLPRDLDE